MEAPKCKLCQGRHWPRQGCKATGQGARKSSSGGVEGNATSAVSSNHADRLRRAGETAAGTNDLRKSAPSAGNRRKVSRETKSQAGIKAGSLETNRSESPGPSPPAVAATARLSASRRGGLRLQPKARSSTRSEQRPLKPKVAGSNPAAPAKKGRGGRPRIEDRENTITAKKPWLAEGMSERTWWRRQAEKRKQERGA